MRFPAWFLVTALPVLVAAVMVTAPAGASAGYADHVVVDKSERTLYLMRDGEVIKSYRVALGRIPRGPKTVEGDGRTPEGSYIFDARRDDSRFYRSLRISYPNPTDRARSSARGMPAGGQIMVHGMAPELERWGADHYLFNWTEGCIAVTNEEMDEIWASVQLGTRIEIRP